MAKKTVTDAKKAKFKKDVQTHFKAHSAKPQAGAKPAGAAAAPTGTCTISAAGLKVTRKNVTEELCARVAKAVGGTYTFT